MIDYKKQVAFWKKHVDDRGMRLAMCERSIFLFALTYFPYMFKSKSPEFHFEWYDLLMFGRDEGSEYEYFEKLILLGFRESAKTSLAKIKMVHSIVYAKHKNMGYVSYDSETSEKALFDVRKWLTTNEGLIADFGNQFEKPLKDSPEKNTQKTFITSRGVRVTAFSIKGSVRGMQSDFERPTFWIIDDFENDTTKVSATKTQNVISFIDELLTGLGSNPEVIFLCNYISMFGSVQNLLDRAKHDKTLKVSRVDLYNGDQLSWPEAYCWTDVEAAELRKMNIIKKSIETLKNTVRSSDGSLDRFNQEYLNEPMSEGEGYFDSDIIKQRLELVKDVPEVGNWRWFKTNDEINEMIRLKDFFVISADVSKGVSRDSSVLQVINITKACQVGEYVDNTIDEHNLGLLMVKYGKKFKALLMPEENNIGVATVNAILGENYNEIYRSREVNKVTNRMSKKYGFNTNSKTKPLILSDLKRDFQNGLLEINSKYLLQEMLLIRKYQLQYTRTNADQTGHYDRLMAFAIGWHGREEIPIRL